MSLPFLDRGSSSPIANKDAVTKLRSVDTK